MPVEPVIRGILDLVDEHAQSMPDQTYRSLADHLMNISCSIEHKEKDAKKNLATQMIVEEPKCIGTGAVYKYTHDPEFMKLVVRTKALELQEYPRPVAAILGTEWKVKLAAALLEADDSMKRLWVWTPRLCASLEPEPLASGGANGGVLESARGAGEEVARRRRICRLAALSQLRMRALVVEWLHALDESSGGGCSRALMLAAGRSLSGATGVSASSLTCSSPSRSGPASGQRPSAEYSSPLCRRAGMT